MAVLNSQLNGWTLDDALFKQFTNIWLLNGPIIAVAGGKRYSIASLSPNFTIKIEVNYFINYGNAIKAPVERRVAGIAVGGRLAINITSHPHSPEDS